MSSSIEEKVRMILNENVNLLLPVEQLQLDDNLANTGINSISIIKSIVAIEAEFGFEFDDEDLDLSRFNTLRDLITYIENRIS